MPKHVLMLGFSYAGITIAHLEVRFLCSQDTHQMKSANKTNQQSHFLQTIKTDQNPLGDFTAFCNFLLLDFYHLGVKQGLLPWQQSCADLSSELHSLDCSAVMLWR